MNFFTEQNFRIAWNQCRKYNYNNYMNFGISGELDFCDKYIEIIIKDIIKKLNSRTYIFSDKYTVYIPKDDGLLRRISISTLEDQLVMQVILNSIGHKIEKKFIKTSYGNRIEKKKGKLSSYIFKPYYIQFNKFINSVIHNIEKGYNWICETDITAYFDTISHERLDEILTNALNVEDTLISYTKDLILDFIKTDVLENGKRRKSERGIPQSIPISSFIGNLYLNDIDYEMSKNKDILFFRYVDDIRILGKSREAVESALLNLQKNILLKDLYINGSKTHIYEVDLDKINKEKIKSLQKEKLSIETVTENDFEDIKQCKSMSLKEEDICDIKNNNFNELEGIIKRKNKLIKHYLIKKNEKKNFKYIEEIISESPKYYYLIQNVKKYRNKVHKDILIKTYNNLVHSQYEVISAQGISDVLNYYEVIDINLNISKIENPRIISILLQNLENKDYIKLLIRKSLLIDKYSLNVIFKQILLALDKLDISDKIKAKVVNKLLNYDILLKDTYIFFHILFKDIIKSNKITEYMIENYQFIYEENFKEKLPTKNIYEIVKRNRFDLYTTRNIIKKIVEGLPDVYIKEPTLINPYNIEILLGDNISIKFSDKCVNIKNKIPEDFIMENGKNELRITYMIGILWFCMFVKKPMNTYNNIVPFIQFSPINYWKYNRHEFEEQSIDNDLLRNELNYVSMMVRKSPSNRMCVEKILKTKIQKECEDKIMQCNKTTNISILHLSDMHFGIEPTSNGKINNTKVEEREFVLEKLISKLKNLDLQLRPNAIVISGDIGWKGIKSDYILAEKWIKIMMSELGIKSERLIMCPGNHDLDRSKAFTKVTPKNASEADLYLSTDHIDDFKSYFEDYQEFLYNMNIKPYKMGNSEDYLSGVAEIDQFRFIILNSAWFCRGDGDKGRLWIGLPLLRTLDVKKQIEKSDSYINIGVIHHTKEWLAQEELHSTEHRMRTYDYLSKFSHVILSGHVHAFPEKSEIMPEGCNIIVGGSTYSGVNYSNNCSIIKIDKENMTFKRTVIEYVPHEGEWSIRENYENNKLVQKDSL